MVMNARELVALGLPQECVAAAFDALKASGLIAQSGDAAQRIGELLAAPDKFAGDQHFAALAKTVLAVRTQLAEAQASWGRNPHGNPSTFAQWGERDDLGSIEQMSAACELPVAVQGVLMPDNHLGYGLPIGGVLGTYDSVIPYGVGVDIACRMMCTITDLPASTLRDVFAPTVDPLIRALTGGTVFGVGGTQREKLDHAVLDMDWNITKVTREMKDRARTQLGTSGSGNHFVEFGIVTLAEPALGLEAGEYVALLSHSGSRGAGAAVCKSYSDIATARLPRSYERFKHLAWLSLDS